MKILPGFLSKYLADVEHKDASAGMYSDFHKLTLDKLSLLFDTSISCGHNSSCADRLLFKNGKNKITQHSQNVFLKMIGYLFTGFCGLLW